MYSLIIYSYRGTPFRGSFARYGPDAFKAGSILRIQEVNCALIVTWNVTGLAIEACFKCYIYI